MGYKNFENHPMIIQKVPSLTQICMLMYKVCTVECTVWPWCSNTICDTTLWLWATIIPSIITSVQGIQTFRAGDNRGR